MNESKSLKTSSALVGLALAAAASGWQDLSGVISDLDRAAYRRNKKKLKKLSGSKKKGKSKERNGKQAKKNKKKKVK